MQEHSNNLGNTLYKCNLASQFYNAYSITYSVTPGMSLICITVKVCSNTSIDFTHKQDNPETSFLNRFPLTVHLRSVQQLLVAFRTQKPRIGVFLHEAVHFRLDLIKTRRSWFQKLLFGVLPGPEVYVDFSRCLDINEFLEDLVGFGHQLSR